MPIFRVKSVKIYTGQKKFTRIYSWRSWQISGMHGISRKGPLQSLLLFLALRPNFQWPRIEWDKNCVWEFWLWPAVFVEVKNSCIPIHLNEDLLWIFLLMRMKILACLITFGKVANFRSNSPKSSPLIKAQNLPKHWAKLVITGF